LEGSLDSARPRIGYYGASKYSACTVDLLGWYSGVSRKRLLDSARVGGKLSNIEMR
jgi:hypothetical protein